jgi:hypothetical protein
MKVLIPAVTLTIAMLMASCAIFVYDDDHSCDKNDSGDTLTIIFSESSSPLEP